MVPKGLGSTSAIVCSRMNVINYCREMLIPTGTSLILESWSNSGAVKGKALLKCCTIESPALKMTTLAEWLLVVTNPLLTVYRSFCEICVCNLSALT